MTVLVVDSAGVPVAIKRVDSAGDLQTINLEDIAGADGLDGAGVLHGTSDPTSGDGVQDDFWINTATNTIFGPKNGASWGSGTSLVGPAGTLADGSVTAVKVSSTLKPSGSAAAGTEALRALGTTASTAAAGNDSRLSDTRTPTDGSVTAAKVAGSLKPSGTAATTDEALRALGTGAGNAAAGNDSRIVNALLQTLFDAKGDQIVASADNTPAKVGVGTNGYVWTADSAQAAGTKWAPPSLSILYSIVATAEARANASYGALTTAGPSITLAAGTDYLVLIGANIQVSANETGFMSFDRGGTGAADADAVKYLSSTTGNNAHVMKAIKLTAPGAITLTAKYRGLSTGNQTYSDRFILAIPVA